MKFLMDNEERFDEYLVDGRAAAKKGDGEGGRCCHFFSEDEGSDDHLQESFRGDS